MLLVKSTGKEASFIARVIMCLYSNSIDACHKSLSNCDGIKSEPATWIYVHNCMCKQQIWKHVVVDHGKCITCQMHQNSCSRVARPQPLLLSFTMSCPGLRPPPESTRCSDDGSGGKPLQPCSLCECAERDKLKKTTSKSTPRIYQVPIPPKQPRQVLDQA